MKYAYDEYHKIYFLKQIALDICNDWTIFNFQSKREAILAAGISGDGEGKYVPSKRGLAAQPKVKEILPPRTP